MMYLLRNDHDTQVRIGYRRDLGTYLCTVHEHGNRVVHHEYELASDCVEKAGEWMPGRPSSAWLWRLVADAELPRVATVDDRTACATCDQCPHIDQCRNGLVECCRLEAVA